MRIGFLRGREDAFPNAFIAKVNSMGRGVSAEFVQLGGTTLCRKYADEKSLKIV